MELLHLAEYENVIRYEIKKKDYARRLAQSKTPLNLVKLNKKLKFASDYLDWTVDERLNIIWIGEIWVIDGQYTRFQVTTKVNIKDKFCINYFNQLSNQFDEVYQETSIIDKFRKRVGQMFGYLVPGTIEEVAQSRRNDDNALLHRGRLIMEELQERNFVPLKWPPFFKDLRPIETVWNWMKNYIQLHHSDLGGEKQRFQDELRLVMKEALDNELSKNLLGLIEKKLARCEALLDVKDGQTGF